MRLAIFTCELKFKGESNDVTCPVVHVRMKRDERGGVDSSEPEACARWRCDHTV